MSELASVASMTRALNWAMTRLARVPGIDYSEQDQAVQEDIARMSAVVDGVIDARTSGRARPDHPDLLELMLKAVHPADGTTLDLENIHNQVVTFLIAGHETTSGAMAFALYHLAKNPPALRLVQREVDELFGDDADPEPTFEDVGRLRMTRQVLNETLRLWPAAPGFGRRAREDTVLAGRIPLRAGDEVRVIIPSLHRDPAWGDNPETFDPYRFTPEAEAARSPHAYKPFGTGERACIGRQFALLGGWAPGMRVALQAGQTCARCANCMRRLRPCLSSYTRGVDYDGGWAQYALAREDTLAPVPDNLPFDQAAIIPDAVSTPYAAIKETGEVGLTDAVGIWCAGGLGAHGVRLARLAGAAPIIAVDPLPSARERALTFGADLALGPADPAAAPARP